MNKSSRSCCSSAGAWLEARAPWGAIRLQPPRVENFYRRRWAEGERGLQQAERHANGRKLEMRNMGSETALQHNIYTSLSICACITSSRAIVSFKKTGCSKPS